VLSKHIFKDGLTRNAEKLLIARNPDILQGFGAYFNR
jgi:hypothetical protein